MLVVSANTHLAITNQLNNTWYRQFDCTLPCLAALNFYIRYFLRQRPLQLKVVQLQPQPIVYRLPWPVFLTTTQINKTYSYWDTIAVADQKGDGWYPTIPIRTCPKICITCSECIWCLCPSFTDSSCWQIVIYFDVSEISAEGTYPPWLITNNLLHLFKLANSAKMLSNP